MLDFEPLELSRKEMSKCTYYELYSLKNHRNIQLFSQQCYYQALILEMNHNVRAYCERPCRICKQYNDSTKPKIIDFIVDNYNSNLLEMQRINYYHNNMIPPLIKQMFIEEENWCRAHEYHYQIISLDECVKSNYYLQNIKYLYGLMRRINSPLYDKYVALLARSLHIRKKVSISEFMNENHLSTYQAMQSVSLGIYQGIFSVQLESGVISMNSEVQLT